MNHYTIKFAIVIIIQLVGNDCKDLYYSMLNTDITYTFYNSYFIASYQSKSKAICLSYCNNDARCMSFVYFISSSSCFLYSKVASSSETQTSSNSVYYYKYCKHYISMNKP